MWRRSRFLRGSTNRYTDGSGRRLDSSNIPSDLDLQPISNRAYPVRGEHWQPVLVGEPSPHKGNVIVSGAGTVGMATAAIFALRGWHATVVERQPSVLRMQSATSEGGEILSSYYGSLSAGLQHALITRRAADALQAAGLRVSAFRHCGVPVTGVLDHPGAYNSWFTRGLVEHHPFAVKMLSVNLLALRQVLEKHLHNLPTGNCRVFHQHVVEAVNPLKQQLVVKPISDSNKPLEGARSAVHNGDDNPFSSNEVDKHGMQQGTHMETSLTLHRVKWEKKYANDAVDYDLLVCAEGVNSRLRDLVDVEGFAADVDFGVRWLVLRSRHLSSEHIHRWLHRRKGPAPLHEVCSPHQVPLAIAFPRIPQNKEAPPTARAGDSEADVEATKSFALMLYAPMDDLQRLSDHEALRTFCPDIVQADGSCNATSYAKNVVPFPTIHCENLYNAVGLPSAVVVGDAAHTCNPFWLQGLAMGLEDGVNLLNQVDAYSKHFYDAIKQYSQERGCSGDALRLITDRCLYYERTKHINPLVRFQDSYRRAMNIILPKIMNEYYTGASVNQLYSKSLESMLNGRGYASYEFAEKQQSKHSAFHHIGRVYTPYACIHSDLKAQVYNSRQKGRIGDGSIMLADGFRFAFSGDVEESIQTTSATHTLPSQGVSKSEKRIPLLEAPVHNLTRRLLDEWCEPCRQDAQELVELHCSESTTAPQLTHQRPPRATELTSFDGKEHRDIIPDKYYGGLKIWSCAPYLVEYMFNNRSIFKDFLLGAAEPLDSERVPNAGGGCRHTIVVELGCGQGLPGIAALLLGAHHVIFQDYNEEVLQLCVKPNVGMNLLRHIDTAGVCRACESCSPVVQLVAGDWDDMCWRDHTTGEGVVVTDDRRILVLGSDVTFDEEACYKLARLLRRMLSTSGGAAYIASKQYYFGTNGGVVEFKRCCAEVELQVLEVDSAGTGGGLQRVILRVECKR